MATPTQLSLGGLHGLCDTVMPDTKWTRGHKKSPPSPAIATDAWNGRQAAHSELSESAFGLHPGHLAEIDSNHID